MNKILKNGLSYDCDCSACEIEKINRSERHDAAMRIGWCLLLATILFIAGCFLSRPASAYTQDQEVKAVIGEAENQGLIGMESVACAISNRGSLSGVYGLHAKRVIKHLYSHQTYNNALKAVLRAKSPVLCSALVHGAQFWEGTAFKTPYWVKTMTLTATIGQQRFYRKD